MDIIFLIIIPVFFIIVIASAFIIGGSIVIRESKEDKIINNIKQKETARILDQLYYNNQASEDQRKDVQLFLDRYFKTNARGDEIDAQLEALVKRPDFKLESSLAYDYVGMYGGSAQSYVSGIEIRKDDYHYDTYSLQPQKSRITSNISIQTLKAIHQFEMKRLKYVFENTSTLKPSHIEKRVAFAEDYFQIDNQFHRMTDEFFKDMTVTDFNQTIDKYQNNDSGGTGGSDSSAAIVAGTVVSTF